MLVPSDRANAHVGFNLLYSFRGGSADGEYPDTVLIQDTSGNLYGTTPLGGPTGCGGFGCGTIFELSLNGQEKILYSFAGGDDGQNPSSGLTPSASGYLYGTALQGKKGFGNVYVLAPNQKLTVLYSFQGVRGENPYGGLIADNEGNLFGTTQDGGKFSAGTVFELTPDGKELVRHYFGGEVRTGGNPRAGLIADNAGNLYGTTLGGGVWGQGTVFRLGPHNDAVTLSSFGYRTTDGSQPAGGLVADSEGNLYGATTYGGSDNAGTVFMITPEGNEKVIYSFKGHSDGIYPFGTLVRSSDGALYGTTQFGGGPTCYTNEAFVGCGTVFRIGPHGNETVLHSFSGPDGQLPQAGLMFGANGKLYGTTGQGGAAGLGTVFEVSQ
jgi:uncharacterized repeat protein (TIGR03803 family)